MMESIKQTRIHKKLNFEELGDYELESANIQHGHEMFLRGIERDLIHDDHLCMTLADSSHHRTVYILGTVGNPAA